MVSLQPNFTYMKESVSTIDAFIAEFPASVQETLGRLRQWIVEEAPLAQPCINYGIPTYKLHGNLVHFSGYKSHIGFYPGASGIKQFSEQLQAYKQGKGSVQFPLTEPLPEALIRDIVRFRVQENLDAERMRLETKQNRITPEYDTGI